MLGQLLGLWDLGPDLLLLLADMWFYICFEGPYVLNVKLAISPGLSALCWLD